MVGWVFFEGGGNGWGFVLFFLLGNTHSLTHCHASFYVFAPVL